MHSRGQVSLSARVSMTGFVYLYERGPFVTDAKIFKFRQLIFNCFWLWARCDWVLLPAVLSKGATRHFIRRMEGSPSTWRKGTMLQNSTLLLMFLVNPGSHLFRTECCLGVIPWNDQRTQLTLHNLQLFLMRPSQGNPRLEKRHSWNQGWVECSWEWTSRLHHILFY